MAVKEGVLEAALKDWKEREQRYEKLFSPAVLKSREFLKEKLRHYDKIRTDVIASPVRQDSIAMQALLLERKALARQVYPNIFRRLLERQVSNFRVDQQVLKAQQNMENGATELRAAMTRMGMGNYCNQAETLMKQGNREFSLPVSYQVSEHERIALQINFKRDDNGRYAMSDYKATLHSQADKAKPRQHTFEFNREESSNLNKAYNLLSGRAVLDPNTNTWSQLDFNDKDGTGNLRMNDLAANYGFDLKTAMGGLPIKEDNKEALFEKLANGDKVKVQLEIGNNKTTAVEISANPIKKEIIIYDITGSVVTLDDLKESKGKSNVKQLVPETREQKQVTKGRSVKL